MREDADPEREVAYIYDNRPRIAKRIAQLKTGYRHAQTPPSKMRRLLSNVELLDQTADTVTIGSNFGAAVSTPIAPRRDLPTVDGPGVRVPALR